MVRKTVGLAVLVGAVLLSACLPKGMRVPQSPLLSALERKSGLIAYVGTDGNIYTIDQGGGNQNALTDDAITEGDELLAYLFPTWAPDGRRVAFVGYKGSSGTGISEASVYVANGDGSDRVQAFTSPHNRPVYLYWSPSGEHLGFLATTPGGENLELDVVPAGGGEPLTLDAGQPLYWSWAPDGQSMLVHVGGSKDLRPDARLARLRLGDLTKGAVIEESMDNRPALFQAPEISPDGMQTLFAAEADDGTPSLMLADASGQVERVIDTFAGTVAFAWSPDGEYIAYINSESARLGALGKLSIVDSRGEKSTIAVENEPVLAFFWAPDGNQLAYFVPSVVQPTAEPTQASGGQGESGAVIRLSLFVADVDTGDSRPVATFVPTNEFLNVLPYFDQYHRSTTLWSPDSRNLVLSAYRGDGTPGIWVAAASGNLEPRFLIEGVTGFWSTK